MSQALKMLAGMMGVPAEQLESLVTGLQTVDFPKLAEGLKTGLENLDKALTLSIAQNSEILRIMKGQGHEVNPAFIVFPGATVPGGSAGGDGDSGSPAPSPGGGSLN